MRATLLAAILVLAGCGSDLRNVALPVHGVAPMNSIDGKESRSVAVRIHPLAADAKFKLATVDQLWTDAKTALGADLLAAPTTITVFPGSAADPAVLQQLDFPGGTRFLGILALYQGSEAQDHRALVVPVEEAEKRGLIFTGFGVELVAPPTPAPAAAASAPAKG